MKQIQIVHQFVKYIAPTTLYLNEKHIIDITHKQHKCYGVRCHLRPFGLSTFSLT
ncbi:hypothetical protein Hanom_Chr15g01413171 [Helianthus anomalus]